MSAPSYAHGASDVPLLGETIGANLRRTVERSGDRETLVVAHQGYRATTLTGKVQKYRMREIAVEELGLQRAARAETA